LQATDLGGHVTVLKFTLLVDTIAPKIAIKEQGVKFTSAPSFDVFTLLEITEANPATSECSTGDLDGDGAPDYSPCGPGEPVSLKKGLNAVNVKLADRVGNGSSVTVEVFLDIEPGVITLLGPEDADNDGDGMADQPFRPSAFDVPFAYSKYGSTVFETSFSCSLTDPQDAAKVKGKVKFFNETKGFGRCAVTEAEPGPAVLTITALDYVGTVTIVKLGFVVDTMPPVITLLDPADQDSDGDGFADKPERPADYFEVPFELDDNSGEVDASSVSCDVRDPQQGTLKGKGIVKGIGGSTTPIKAVCVVTDATPGVAAITISAADRSLNDTRKSILAIIR
jgi:hypothetical protein